MQDSDSLTQINEWFENGPLTKSPEFSYRESQHQLALKIGQTLLDNQQLIAEAGTGIGKTLAYLIPVLFSDKKVIISTGTKHLQDQILKKDLPQLRAVMPVTKRIELLKGRANYLCLYRTDMLTIEDDFFGADKLHDLNTVKTWSQKLKHGDIAEIPDVADDAEIWPLVTSTTDNCLGSDCAYFNDCYLVKARRQALKADVLIVNHHLFFADLVMREEGFGEILPSFNAVIFDEAHQLPDVAANFFGDRFSSRQISYLQQDTMRAVKAHALDAGDMVAASNQLKKSLDQMQLILNLFPNRGDFGDIKHDPRLQKSLLNIGEQLDEFVKQIEPLSERHQIFDNAKQRAVNFKQQFKLMQQEPENMVHWYEVFRQSFVIHQTPIDVAERLRPTFAKKQPWVFTSATLSVNQSMEHFQKALGLESATVSIHDSPFEYPRQAIMYMPSHLPDPRDAQYTERLVQAAIPVIEAAGGRTFFLVTSYRALDCVKQILEEELDFPVLSQGSMAKHRLLAEFVAAGDAVLIGTSSFWEGVDVKGQALSCVIIDKLPFASPADPIMKAKMQYYRKHQRDPFQEYQLPKAVLQLRQGVGRLIRDVSDRGVLMIGDNRLIHKAYGKIFWQSLPRIPVTRRLKTVENFLRHDETTCV